MWRYGWIHRRVRRGKRAQTTRITSFGLLVHVFIFSFRVFFFTDLYLQVLQVLWSYRLTYRGLQREERAQTNTYRIVWAIHKFFFIIIRVFLPLLIT